MSVSNEIGNCIVFLGLDPKTGEPLLEKRSFSVPTQLEEIGKGEVIVRLLAATICGSDLHTLRGKRPNEPVPRYRTLSGPK